MREAVTYHTGSMTLYVHFFRPSYGVTVIKVEIAEFDRVAPTQPTQIVVTTTPSPLPSGCSISLVCETDAGTMGSATVSPTIINQTTTVTITGGAQSWGTGASAAPNNIKLRAKLAAYICAEESFTVCAHINNFHQTLGEPVDDGVLHFEYAWTSDSGALSDLDMVESGEHVTYDGVGSYYPPLPPFWLLPFNNPTDLNFSSSVGGIGLDDHGHYDFSTPYATASFSGSQIYRQRCKRCAEDWVTLMGPLSIDRYVEVWGASWRYRIKKSGVEATKQLYP